MNEVAILPRAESRHGFTRRGVHTSEINSVNSLMRFGVKIVLPAVHNFLVATGQAVEVNRRDFSFIKIKIAA